MSALFCFGLGYCAQALAALLRPEGWRVSGTVRAQDKVAGLRGQGIEALIFDGDHARDDVRAALAQATHLLVSAPPGAAGDPVLARFSDEIAAHARLDWIGYLSSVGVYGDHGGGWVDEETPPAPVNARSRRRLAAEAAWTELAARAAIPLGIFRIAGIYGPGRNQLASLKAGTARRIVKKDQVFNRVHAGDIAAILAASIGRPPQGTRIYNVCDDMPAPPQDVVAYAASLLGIDPPPEEPFETAELSDMAKSFYGDNKRCSNARVKKELGVNLSFPDYREGLTALFDADAY